MEYNEALDKVRKLLRLAQSDNPNEAALAASRAQEIMTRYKIEALSVEETAESKPDEPIKDFGIDPLENVRATWKSRLASFIARQNQCQVYSGSARYRVRNLSLIGRASDVQTVRYLYGWMAREVERLAARDCAGCGATYWNNYRIGVVETVVNRLHEANKATESQVRVEAQAVSECALMIVNHALAKREKQMADVIKFGKDVVGLRSGGGGGGSRYNPSARDAGRAAGHEVRIQPSSGNLGSGTFRLQ